MHRARTRGWFRRTNARAGDPVDSVVHTMSSSPLERTGRTRLTRRPGCDNGRSRGGRASSYADVLTLAFLLVLRAGGGPPGLTCELRDHRLALFLRQILDEGVVGRLE